MSAELTQGAFCLNGDRVVQFDGMDSLAFALVRDIATGRIESIHVSKLRAVPKQNAAQDIGYIKDDEWKRCSALAKDLLPLVEAARIPHATYLPIAKRHGLSVRQLQRMRKRLQQSQRASALARSSGGRPQGFNALSAVVHDIINRLIERHYLRRERAAKMDIVERARSVCRRLDLTPPSKNAVLRRIGDYDRYEADLKRLGRKVAQQKWTPRPGRLDAAAPLDIVQIDHTRVDVMVVSEDRQTVLGRPWITLAIDVCSRVVLGMYLSMDAPSSVSVSLCIEHLVLPKVGSSDPEGALWPMYGKPRCILVDNGKDLRAEALKRGCEEHGIDLQWRPVRTPHYGAHIERLNGTLMRLCHLLPGTTFSNPREKGDYNPEQHAKLNLAELKDWLVEKICRYYHVRTHRGIGLPPSVAWERAFTDEQGKLRPPPIVANPESFRIDFLPYEFRQINRTGIELAGSRYWHADLVPLLRSPEPTMVRYDPRARQSVWVRLAEDRFLEVPAIAGRAAGDPVRRVTLDAETQARLDREIDEHFKNCDAIEERAERATHRARKKSGASRPAQVAVPPAEVTPKPLAIPATAPDETPTTHDALNQAVREAVDSDEVAKKRNQPQSRPREQPAADQREPNGRDASGAAAPPPLRAPATSPLPVEDWF